MAAATPDASSSGPPDPDRVRAYAKLLFTQLSGAVTAGMTHLGDRLGLYAGLAGLGCTDADALAAAAGLDPRWVLEWLRNQGAAGLVEWEAGPDGDVRWWLAPEAVPVVVDEDSPSFGAGSFHDLPQTMALLQRLPEAFRTGRGFDYDALGDEGAAGMERSFLPWLRANLVTTVLPLLDGVADDLALGAVAGDVGCGAGGALLLLAAAFPASAFHGWEVSRHALARAEANRDSAGAGLVDQPQVSFHDVAVDPLPADGSLRLVTTFDCVHDMTDPAGVVAAIRAALRPDGTWLLVDLKARDSYAENVAKNPMAAMMYGMSVLTCMSSALSEPGGAGLGTLGLPESRARALSAAAGFTRFRRLSVEHPVNAFYEIRP